MGERERKETWNSPNASRDPLNFLNLDDTFSGGVKESPGGDIKWPLG